MTISSQRARLVLERYKLASSPARAEKARLLLIIQRRGLRGDLPQFYVSTSAPLVPTASLSQAVWGSSLGKAGLVFVATGLSAVGLYQVMESRSKPAPTEAAYPERAPPAAEQLLTRGEELGAPLVDSATSPSLDRRSGLPRTGSSSEQTIDEEVKLVTGAQTASRSGDSRRALQLLSEHARRFPNGKLANARVVEHMIVLCSMGSVDRARLEAERFLASYPNSPFAERVKDICGPSTDAQ